MAFPSDIASFKLVGDLLPKYDGNMNRLNHFSTEHSLTFILEIPSIEPTTYDYIHIYSLPNNQNLTVIPKSKYLALGSDEYTYLEEDCKKISEYTWLCKLEDSRSIEKSEDCIISLIRHKEGNCTRARMSLKHGKLQKIQGNTWLAVPLEPQVIRTQCGQKIEYKKISGPSIFNMTQDCQINIMNRTLRTHSTTININEIIPLPRNLMNTPIQYEIHLEDISLDSIHELVNKIEDIQHTDTIEWHHLMAIPSWSTMILYIAAIATVAWKLYDWKKSRQTSREDAPGSCTTSFHLREGGVNMS